MEQLRQSILIVDDESEIREALGEILSEHFRVCFAKGGQEAIDSAKRILPSLILLDVLMPKVNGWKVCEAIREESSTRDIPIIFLSALQDPESRLRAFKLGAADFVAKPFHPGELLARIEARLKSVTPNDTTERNRNFPKPTKINGNSIQFLDLDLHVASRSLSVSGGKPSKLRDMEARILEFLMRNANSLCTREAISKFVWDEGAKTHRNLDAHISALRKKLKKSRVSLNAEYGRGYTLSESAVH